MSVRTASQAPHLPQKPRNARKPRRTPSDQQRAMLLVPKHRAPQKPAGSPHKAEAMCGGLPRVHFCVGSPEICGAVPHSTNAPGQTSHLPVSADSADSAAPNRPGTYQSKPEERAVNNAISPSMEGTDTTLVLLTVEEAARRLSIGRTYCFRLVATGELESVTMGRARRVPADAVVEFSRKLRERQRHGALLAEPKGVAA